MKTEVLGQDDPRITFVHQGVQQLEDGRAFRQAVLKDGTDALVDAADSRTFSLSNGTFGENSLHVLVTDEQGTRRAGGAYQI